MYIEMGADKVIAGHQRGSLRRPRVKGLHAALPFGVSVTSTGLPGVSRLAVVATSSTLMASHAWMVIGACRLSENILSKRGAPRIDAKRLRGCLETPSGEGLVKSQTDGIYEKIPFPRIPHVDPYHPSGARSGSFALWQ